MLKVRILSEAKAQLTPIQLHNLNFILNNDEVMADLGDLDIYDMEDVDTLVKKVTALSKSKITNYITGKSFGKVFRLANGRILKMFSESIDEEEDINWYRQSLERIFRGIASAQTLPIFDWGKPKIVGKVVYWGEMAELTPFNKWLEQTGREENNNEFYVLLDFFEEKSSIKLLDFGKWLFKQIKNKSPRFPEDKKQMYAKLLGKESTTQITAAEMAALLKAVKEITDSGFKLKDIFPRNVGKIRQSRPDKPIFVVFDN